MKVRMIKALVVFLTCAALLPAAATAAGPGEKGASAKKSGPAKKAKKEAEPKKDEAAKKEGAAEAAAAQGAEKEADVKVKDEAEARRAVDSVSCLGTQVIFVAYHDKPAVAKEAFAKAKDELKRLDALLDARKEGSDVSAINKAAGGDPVKVSMDTIKVIQLAIEVSQNTGGLFDVTYAVLDNLWDFTAKEPKVPDKEAIKKVLPLIDFKKLSVDPVKMTVRLQEKGMRVNPAGLSRGYALDRALSIVLAAGVPDVRIGTSDQVVVSGKEKNREWRMGVIDPRAKDKIRAYVPLILPATATSTDGGRFFEIGGVRYHHIFDPRTGMPARGFRSVTVFSDSPGRSDAYATAIFVVGPEAGLELTHRTPGLEFVGIDSQDRLVVSKGLSSLIEEVK